MSEEMANPHHGMISFQEGLQSGILKLTLVRPHVDLYSHFDVPAPGVARLTYVRLDADRRSIKAFLSCVMNGKVDGFPCVALGYAVPEHLRNKGLAQTIMRDVIQDQIVKAHRAGHSSVYVEAVVDKTNLASQRVAAAVLIVEPEEIVEGESKRPAYRYTKRFDSPSTQRTALASHTAGSPIEQQ